MTTAAPAQPAPPPAEYVEASREEQLRAAYRRYHHATAKLDPVPSSRVMRGYHTVWDAVSPWLDLARQRLAEAAGSPADSTRWQHLLTALAEPAGRHIDQPTYTGLVSLRGKGKDFFRALIEAEKPGPTVAEIADQIHRAIKDERYWPGQRLSAYKIAVEYGAATERVKLALQDLKHAGIVTLSPSGRASVSAPAPASRSKTIAGWLTTLIEHGVYPPASPLPRHTSLARSLVCSLAHVNEAVRQLRDSGLLTVSPSGRTTVAATAPSRPLDIQSVITQLPPEPAQAASSTHIRKTAAAARRWWLHQVFPPPEEHRQVFHTLQSMTASLLSSTTPLSELHPKAQAAIRRAAVTAIAPLPASPQERTWRTACLGAALVDALPPTEPADISSPACVRLTPAERRVAELLITGKTDRQIAERLGVSVRTVNGHVVRIGRKVPTALTREGRTHALLLRGEVTVSPLRSPAPDFTPAELRLLRAVAEQPTTHDIARAAGLASADCRPAITALVTKAKATNAVDLIRRAHAWGLLDGLTSATP